MSGAEKCWRCGAKVHGKFTLKGLGDEEVFTVAGCMPCQHAASALATRIYAKTPLEREDVDKAIAVIKMELGIP